MKHLTRGSIAAWDCKSFIENGMNCKKDHDVCEGRECPNFEVKSGG